MDKKKIWIIVGIIATVLVVVLGTVLIIKAVNKDDEVEPMRQQQRREDEGETGAFNKLSYTSNGYIVEIDSTKPGHPADDVKFQATLSYKTSDGGTEDYTIEYLNVEEYLNDATTLGININGKEYSYTLGAADSSTTLTYIIPNSNRMALQIRIRGTAKFDADGQQCKCLPIIDEEFLKSEELAGVLNYNISKE